VAAALTESRDELRDAAATMTARFAGAEERARRLAATSVIRDTVLQVCAEALVLTAALCLHHVPCYFFMQKGADVEVARNVVYGEWHGHPLGC
jgi:hypothetical protein